MSSRSTGTASPSRVLGLVDDLGGGVVTFTGAATLPRLAVTSKGVDAITRKTRWLALQAKGYAAVKRVVDNQCLLAMATLAPDVVPLLPTAGPQLFDHDWTKPDGTLATCKEYLRVKLTQWERYKDDYPSLPQQWSDRAAHVASMVACQGYIETLASSLEVGASGPGHLAFRVCWARRDVIPNERLGDGEVMDRWIIDPDNIFHDRVGGDGDADLICENHFSFPPTTDTHTQQQVDNWGQGRGMWGLLVVTVPCGTLPTYVCLTCEEHDDSYNVHATRSCQREYPGCGNIFFGDDAGEQVLYTDEGEVEGEPLEVCPACEEELAPGREARARQARVLREARETAERHRHRRAENERWVKAEDDRVNKGWMEEGKATYISDE